MIYEVKDLDDFGRGIVNVDSKICFVKNALPKEKIKLKLIKNKKNYSEAIVEEYVKTSSKRIKPRCKYYHVCGGCQLEHLKIEEENKYKLKKVESILNKFAHINLKITKISCGKEYSYRNKITLNIIDGKICLFKEKSNDFVEIEQCPLVEDKINEVILKLKDIVKEEKGITKIMLRLGNYTNEMMLKIEGKVQDKTKFLSLANSIIINNKPIRNDVITSKVLNYQYLVSGDSFFQINREVVEMMYAKIVELIRKSNAQNVLDLYCGVGTIAITISKYVKRVIGVEVVEDAIKNAEKNKVLNQVSNVDFICGKVEDVISNKQFICDAIIVDPPRRGIDKKAITILNNSHVKTIIYISCDPVTLARDINKLDAYEVKHVELFNMFPRTYHVECVCVLKLH